MAERRRLEIAAAIVALLACGAFIASFLLGLRGASPATTGIAPEPAIETPPARTAGRLEVLNASGRAGHARAATDQLRSSGFDVVYFGNHRTTGDSSAVLDRSGNAGIANAAAKALGITRVRTQRDTTLYLDATVIVGVDWEPGGN